MYRWQSEYRPYGSEWLFSREKGWSLNGTGTGINK
jgi:hypothetical protein